MRSEKTPQTVRTLDFSKMWKEVVVNVWKLIEILRFQFIYYTVITGRGSEFDRLREYEEGDDARLIDWNSYARCSKPYIKVFKEERMLDIVFLVDVSTTMTLGTTEMVKNEYASLLTTTLALVSQTLGDRVCLIAFADGIKAFVEPSLSIETVLQIGKTLCDPQIYGGGKKWETVTHPVLETFTPETFLFIISDFIGERECLYDFVLKASNRFKGVAGIMLRDPLDSYLPEGIGKIYLQDPSTGEVMLVDADKIRDEYNEKAKREEEEVHEEFLKCGVLFRKIYPTEKDIPGFILKLFGGKIWK